ncbi:MAG: tetratricopeptide repeat protein [Deltaproteobacteria bacterium]|nr:tetratricopeptide repeat protein [Deltaproteobacteria bacterium]
MRLSCTELVGYWRHLGPVLGCWGWVSVLLVTGCVPKGDHLAPTDSSVVTGPAQRSAERAEAWSGLRFTNGRVLLEDAGSEAGANLSEVDLRQELEEANRLLGGGQRLEALRGFARVVRTSPDSVAGLDGLGVALLRLRETGKAEAAFRTALDQAPDRPEIHAHLAAVLERQGRWVEAEERWQRVLSIDSGSGTANLRLATLAHWRGDSAAAREFLSRARFLGELVPAVLAAAIEVGDPVAVKGGARDDLAPRLGGIILHAPVRVDPGGQMNQANEPSMAGAGSEWVAAWNDERRPGGVGAWSLGAAISLDGGLTWSDSLLDPPGALPENFQADPMTAYDPRTGNFWVGGIGFFGGPVYVARKAPGAATFEPPVEVSTGAADKGWMVAGRSPSNPNSTLLYVAYDRGLQVSDDLGQTWSAVRPLALEGTGYHPRVGPQGELYLSYWDFDLGVWMYRSLDGGQTLQGPQRIATRMDTWGPQDSSRAPGSFRVANLSFLAVDPRNGDLFCAYHDTTQVIGGQSDLDIYLTQSRDGGDTWSPAVILNGDLDPPGDQFLPWIEVDEAGRLHAVFFDSRHTPQMDDVEHGMIDVYYAVSLDRGQSWTEVRLTAQSFDSADAIWEVGGQFLGDYLGAVTDGDTVRVIYPTTESGDLDIWTRRIDLPSREIFADDFESGNTSAWPSSTP